ncbi:hypothetical protein [Intestinibacter sp.]|uniref:hypothetical protein n=1 Tax=Intestinibacter sp. TaxID=1965304 RepID=UPI003F1375EB
MITYEEAANVNSLSNMSGSNSSIFNGTDIEYFEELQYFTGLISKSGMWTNCKKLRKVKLPLIQNMEIGFKNCY